MYYIGIDARLLTISCIRIVVENAGKRGEVKSGIKNGVGLTIIGDDINFYYMNCVSQ